MSHNNFYDYTSIVLPERFAIISDIHSNLAALEAVFNDIDQHNLEYVFCLGDVIGYGPQPIECWELVKKRCQIILLGNHEAALDPKHAKRFHPRAKKAIDWTRNQFLEYPDGIKIVSEIISLPTSFSCEEMLFVHASPYDPTFEYILPYDSKIEVFMNKQFDLFDQYAFNGHTHLAGIFELGEAFKKQADLNNNIYSLNNKKAIINIGSVGQPRDDNPCASYAIIDKNEVIYRRVAYDVNLTTNLILKFPCLDPFLARRLLSGK